RARTRVPDHDDNAAFDKGLRRSSALFGIAAIVGLDNRDALAEHATFGIDPFGCRLSCAADLRTGPICRRGNAHDDICTCRQRLQKGK
ncbi:MAG: hypothetical protein V3R26_02395, partial [Hyphomicrobium sp.]